MAVKGICVKLSPDGHMGSPFPRPSRHETQKTASPSTTFSGNKVSVCLFCLFFSPVFVLEKDLDMVAINSHLKK